MQRQTIIRDLGDGLVLRRSTPLDADALAEFNAKIHGESESDAPRLAAWTRDLLTRPHPTFHPDDFTIVEETATGRIVSSCNLISQQWAYEGIPFGVGRVELVGTLAEFRGRGLVRAQFEELHKWSAERGEMVQSITGIPYFYRQFGYEMGLELGGGRVGFEPMFPRLKEGESEPFVVRPAREADLPFILDVYAHAQKRSLVTSHRDETILRYEIFGKSKENVNHPEFCVIERADGEPVGYFTHPPFNWNMGLVLFEFEVKPGVSWLEVSPSVVRYALAKGKEYAQRDNEPLEMKNGVAFWHGTAHPAYAVLRDRLPRVRLAYAWYVRVADVAGFIRHIAPALEQRLAESYLPGYSGTLFYNFYRDGLKLVFEKGKLKEAESYKPASGMHDDAGFPDLSFLQLVFGYRSMDELRAHYADCYAESEDAHVVTAALFPKKPSQVIGLT